MASLYCLALSVEPHRYREIRLHAVWHKECRPFQKATREPRLSVPPAADCCLRSLHGRRASGQWCVARCICIDAVVFIHQGLMPVLLSPQGPRDPHRTVHHAAALVVRHRTEGIQFPLAVPFSVGRSSRNSRCLRPWLRPPQKIRQQRSAASFRVVLKRTSKIMQIPYLTPQGGFSCRFAAIHLLSLICGKDHGIAVDEGLHLHITGGHQRTSYTI